MQQYENNQPYAHPYPPAYVPPIYVVSRPTNSTAVVSLVFGILGWTLLPVLGAVIAVIAGHAAQGEIKRTGAGGSGIAMAGLILGWLQVGPGILLVILAVLMGIALLSGVR